MSEPVELHAPERRDLWQQLAEWGHPPELLNAYVSVMEFCEQHPGLVRNWFRQWRDDRLGVGLPGTFAFELYLSNGTMRIVHVPECRCAATVAAAFEGIG